MTDPNHKGVSPLDRNTLARLHIARKELCLDEDDYRDLLERITGKRSARDIGPESLPALQKELRRIGWNGWLTPRKSGIQTRPYPDGRKKYEDMDNRPGRPTGAQLRMLEARFVSLKGFADINPAAAFRQFLQKRFGISHVKLLDNKTYEAALSAVKRLEHERGVKE